MSRRSDSSEKKEDKTDFTFSSINYYGCLVKKIINVIDNDKVEKLLCFDDPLSTVIQVKLQNIIV